ncbi:MAG: hypothetical protein LBV80_05765 [Deltaproteobacteria bacterium]|jgi:hypothetical protein|nr:hypothetical protein [Deltaproteobacteria bacterium]
MKAYHQGQLDFFCGIYALINALRLTSGIGLADARRILAEALGAVSAYPLLWRATLDNSTDFYWLMRYLLGRYSRERGLAFRIARLPMTSLKSAERLRLREKVGAQAAGSRRPQFAMGGSCGLSDAELRAWLNLSPPPLLELADLRPQDLRFRQPDNGVPTPRECGWTLSELWPLLEDWLPIKTLFSGFSQGEGSGRCLILRFHRHLYADQPPVISHWTCGQEFNRDTLQLFDCTADKSAVHSLPFKQCALRESELSKDRLLRLEPDSIYFLERM